MKKFEQLSNKPSYMKHNGGLLFRSISKKKFEFKTKIKNIQALSNPESLKQFKNLIELKN